MILWSVKVSSRDICKTDYAHEGIRLNSIERTHTGVLILLEELEDVKTSSLTDKKTEWP